MGTIGLSFGSPTSGQGFDVATTVSQIVSNYQAVEAPWKSSLRSLQAQDAVFSQIGNDLATLATKLNALTDFQGVLSGKQGSSSDTSILALTTAQSAASAGSYTVVVNQVAQAASYYTPSVAAAMLFSRAASLSKKAMGRLSALAWIRRARVWRRLPPTSIVLGVKRLLP